MTTHPRRLVCFVEGCETEVHCRGLCGAHYAAERRAGAGNKGTCGEPDCSKANYAQGVCQSHYKMGLNSGRIVKNGCREYGCTKPRIASWRCEDHQPPPPACLVEGCSRDMGENRTYCVSHWQRARKYGLTKEEMAALDAGVTCKLCPEPATAVDHCHATGAVRGFLCSQCNMGLGSFKDNPELLFNAIEYLLRRDETRAADIQTQLGLAA